MSTVIEMRPVSVGGLVNRMWRWHRNRGEFLHAAAPSWHVLDGAGALVASYADAGALEARARELGLLHPWEAVDPTFRAVRRGGRKGA